MIIFQYSYQSLLEFESLSTGNSPKARAPLCLVQHFSGLALCLQIPSKLLLTSLPSLLCFINHKCDLFGHNQLYCTHLSSVLRLPGRAHPFHSLLSWRLLAFNYQAALLGHFTAHLPFLSPQQEPRISPASSPAGF